MNEKRLTHLMYALIVVGLGTAAVGVGLVIFTDIVTGHGVQGIAIVAALIAGGLFLALREFPWKPLDVVFASCGHFP